MQNTSWNQPDVVSATAPVSDLPFALLPLSTGEVLDRSFSLYRLRFWLFAGIAAMPAAVSVVFSIGMLIYAARHPAPVPVVGANPFSAIPFTSSVLSTISGLVYLIVYGVAKAATTSAVSSVYLGQPTSVGTAYSAISSRWLRWIGITFWQIGSAMWAFFIAVVGIAVLFAFASKAPGLAVVGGVVAFLAIPASLVFGAIFYIRNSLAIPAGVMEDTGVRNSMRRSKELVSGRKGRIFLLFLLYFVLALVAGAAQTPLVFLALKVHGGERYLLQALQLFTSFIISTVIAPIPAIGLCLFYLDERVRREGFDVEYMMGQVAAIDTGLTPALPTEG